MTTAIAATHPRAAPQRRRGLLTAAESAAIALLLFIIAIAASIASSLGHARAAQATAEPFPVFVTPGEMKSGALLFQGTQEGRYVEAPRLGTDIGLTVSGPTIRARVTQMFNNPTKGWVEGVYVYPLPEGAAVDSMKMIIGKRIVVADIKKKEEAREIYERAKEAGNKAALVEQERPNIFTNSIANIGPGETVIVEIEYQEPVRQGTGTFSLRVPLVVAPRYNPAPAVLQGVEFEAGQGGWGRVADEVPDRERITPPVLDPRKEDPTNPVTLSIALQAGFPLGEVKSHHHAVKMESSSPDVRRISLADGPVPADRDFELTWTSAAAKAPTIGLFREEVAGSDYLLAFVTPPSLEQAAATNRRPREIVFVIDNSGSMGGTSMGQAKDSLLYALGRLQPGDRFNVIRFDDSMDMVFADTVPADGETVGRAKRFVAALEANGGTEMLPPLKAALADPRPGDQAFLRQVIFLTDGAIGNEHQLFDVISAGRGRSRIFMVGIGSTPNSYLMNRAAELGRGTFTHIGSTEEVEGRMRSLFEKLESPVVTNLTASFSAGEADMTPRILPDLYQGEPLVLAARLKALEGTVEVRGTVGDRPWSVTLPLARAAEGRGLSKLWARRKIDDAEVAQTLGQTTSEETEKVILRLALDHNLVTRLTSLVAVDESPSRPKGEALTRADLPLNLPAGWDFEKVFGSGADRAGDSDPASHPVPAAQQRGAQAHTAIQLAEAALPGVAQLAAPAPAKARSRSVALPQTATDAETRVWIGLILLAASLLLWGLGFLGRRRLA
jgi:Ca-activated chloride channel family protein